MTLALLLGSVRAESGYPSLKHLMAAIRPSYSKFVESL